MEFMIDRSGAPAIKFSGTKYIYILPVTKYQFERFIWSTAPSWCDYEKIIEDTGRISPHEINIKNLSSAFLTNINFEEAQEICRWLCGRLPTVKEWDEVYEMVFSNYLLFDEALKYMTEMKEKRKIDIRILKLLEHLHRLGIKRRDLNSSIGELVSEFPVEPYGRIYLKHNQEQALITGSPSKKTRGNNFGLCCVLSYVDE
ncbi:MAG: hypothetical protein SCARUB_00145 [Candidatus Scalindua rubra]|uniref:Sulfatase-modifying factor enzyme-like domain-containing protein n=1 Tax=Candidatus Scalindua rubra TaxID=1872076 RepID=A0A1E3XGH2_9BACT|nr:MAG: hypothetical protein SCARUB_00145 [Candidatus Scalindua rubra]